jgi:hypothetical protein
MSFDESKSFQKFRSRVEYLNQHLQIIDASLLTTSRLLNKVEDKSDIISSSLNLDGEIYDLLNHPVNDKLRIINYSRSKNSEYAIIELYNAFSNYLKDLLIEFYQKDPEKIAGKAAGQSLSFNDIVGLGSYENISQKIISVVFRKLENKRSTVKLLDGILSHTKIELDNNLKTKGLMYLEVRHLIIHSNCKADDEFKRKYDQLIQIKADGKVPMKFDIVNDAIESLINLAKSIDKTLINENFIAMR